MKTTACFILAALLACTATADVTKTIEETHPLAADGVLKLSNVNGSIEITAWDNNEVSLVAELRAKTQEDLDRIHVNIDAQPARLTIETKHEKREGWFGNKGDSGSVTYTLKVPAGITLDSIESVNSGVRLNGLTGRIRARTVNGSIRADGLGGEASLGTVNGSITAAFSRVATAANISLHTVNGSCELALPAEASGQVSAGTVNGRVRSELPITVEHSKRNKLRGTLGSGEGEIELESVNGSLTLKKS